MSNRGSTSNLLKPPEIVLKALRIIAEHDILFINFARELIAKVGEDEDIFDKLKHIMDNPSKYEKLSTYVDEFLELHKYRVELLKLYTTTDITTKVSHDSAVLRGDTLAKLIALHTALVKLKAIYNKDDDGESAGPVTLNKLTGIADDKAKLLKLYESSDGATINVGSSDSPDNQPDNLAKFNKLYEALDQLLAIHTKPDNQGDDHTELHGNQLLEISAVYDKLTEIEYIYNDLIKDSTSILKKIYADLEKETNSWLQTIGTDLLLEDNSELRAIGQDLLFVNSKLKRLHQSIENIDKVVEQDSEDQSYKYLEAIETLSDDLDLDDPSALDYDPKLNSQSKIVRVYSNMDAINTAESVLNALQAFETAINNINDNVDNIEATGEDLKLGENGEDSTIKKVGQDLLLGDQSKIAKVAEDLFLGLNSMISKLYQDFVRAGGSFIEKVGTDLLLERDSRVEKVGIDLLLGDDSKVKIAADNIENIDTVVDNMVDINNAEENANLAIQARDKAKDWSIKSNEPVEDGFYGAKWYAKRAKEWANKENDPVLGELYSSKHYADQAAQTLEEVKNYLDQPSSELDHTSNLNEVEFALPDHIVGGNEYDITINNLPDDLIYHLETSDGVILTHTEFHPTEASITFRYQAPDVEEQVQRIFYILARDPEGNDLHKTKRFTIEPRCPMSSNELLLPVSDTDSGTVGLQLDAEDEVVRGFAIV